MNNATQLPERERQPELKEVLMYLDQQANRLDGLSVEIKNKVQSICLFPVKEEPLNAELKKGVQDVVGEINGQIKRVSDYADRFEEILRWLQKIV